MSSKLPLIVSAIIPAFNASRTLERAVLSLQDSLPTGLEVIIVDDGSSDDTFEIAKRLASDCPGSIRAYQHPNGQNFGVSKTRNLGIELASCELLCFLDADDTVERNRFTESLSVLDSYDDVDAVYGRTDVSIDDVSQHEHWNDGETFGIQNGLVGDPLLKSLVEGAPWHTSSVLLRRNLLNRTGLFDERFSIAEDCHLWLRMVVLGNVIPISFDFPISRYHRQASSLYMPSIERKLDYLLVLQDFWAWTERMGIDPQRRRAIECMISHWIDNAIVQSRVGRDTKTARRLACQALIGSRRLISYPRIFSHLLRSLG